jgi:hypothetical protein
MCFDAGFIRGSSGLVYAVLYTVLYSVVYALYMQFCTKYNAQSTNEREKYFELLYHLQLHQFPGLANAAVAHYC